MTLRAFLIFKLAKTSRLSAGVTGGGMHTDEYGDFFASSRLLGVLIKTLLLLTFSMQVKAAHWSEELIS